MYLFKIQIYCVTGILYILSPSLCSHDSHKQTEHVCYKLSNIMLGCNNRERSKLQRHLSKSMHATRDRKYILLDIMEQVVIRSSLIMDSCSTTHIIIHTHDGWILLIDIFGLDEINQVAVFFHLLAARTSQMEVNTNTPCKFRPRYI